MFLFLIFIMTYIVLGQRIIHLNEDKRQETVIQIQNTILDEIRLAQSVENGYKRPFSLPREIMGVPFNLTIENHSTLVINMEGKDYTKGLPTFVMGGFCMNGTSGPRYNLSISRDFDIVSVSSCYNCTYSYAQCANAQMMGLCDSMDTFFAGFKSVCCSGHCRCCCAGC
jgi:hypothetical protein